MTGKFSHAYALEQIAQDSIVRATQGLLLCCLQSGIAQLGLTEQVKVWHWASDQPILQDTTSNEEHLSKCTVRMNLRAPAA